MADKMKISKSMYPLDPAHPSVSSSKGDAGNTGMVVDKGIEGRDGDKMSIGTYKTKRGL